MKYADWLEKVDGFIQGVTDGLTHEDFPDLCHRDAYDAGDSPREWAEECLETWGFNVPRRD